MDIVSRVEVCQFGEIVLNGSDCFPYAGDETEYSYSFDIGLYSMSSLTVRGESHWYEKSQDFSANVVVGRPYQ